MKTTNYYKEFWKLMDDYDRWFYEPHDMSADDMRRFFSEMLPVEEYLRRFWQAGNASSMWIMDYSEKYKFRNLPDGVNLVAYRHFRYDCHERHEHDYFQLNYVWEGGASIDINGTDVPFTKGDFILLMPGTMHRLQVFCDDCVVLKIYIRRSTFEKTFFKWLGESNALSDIFKRTIYDNKANNYMIFHTGEDEVLRELVLSVCAESLNSRKYGCIVTECKLTEIFCLLARSYMDSAYTYDDSGSSSVGFIVKYILENRATVTLDELAAWAGYSKNYLCRLLMQRTGKTFLQIVNTAKLEAAVKLLTTTGLSMEEISQSAGFSGAKQFYRIFSQQYGMTPKQYRQEKKNEHT